MSSKTLAALAAVLISGSLVLPTTAQAAEPSPAVESIAVRVKTADLDLSSAEGQARLDRRMQRAINRMCAVEDLMSHTARQAERACKEAASAAASRGVRVAIARQAQARRA